MRDKYLVRLENECREALKVAYDLMIDCEFSQLKAYGYAEDLLEGMFNALMALQLFEYLDLIRYYKAVCRNRRYKEIDDKIKAWKK